MEFSPDLGHAYVRAYVRICVCAYGRACVRACVYIRDEFKFKMKLLTLTLPKFCSGTRLKVITLQQNVIEAEVWIAGGIGEIIFVPRIPFIPYNFRFRCKLLQFPINVCFAITIINRQGERSKPRERSEDLVFFACSRVSHPEQLFILAPQQQTSNIIFKEIL